MKEIKISGEYIKLDSFLKYAEVASTGGHAKYLISEGMISVNGNIAHERGKKIRVGDRVKVVNEDENFDETYLIISQ
jgi:ribosome-associated protein